MAINWNDGYIPVKRLKTTLVMVVTVFLLSGCSADGELKWVEEEGHRWANLNTGLWGSTGFRPLDASRTGITFRNDVSDESIRRNRHYANGSGVAVGDVTGNGFPDIYFASLEGPNRLYENLGDYRFRDITDDAGVAHEGVNSTGVVFVDVNGNGHLDLIITSLSDENTLYLNDGSGRFERKENSGLGPARGAHSMALADINGNGRLDLYIANYRLRSVRDIYGPDALAMEHTVEEDENGRLNVLPEFREFYEIIDVGGQQLRRESGEVDELYLNKGEGLFEKADPEKVFPVNDKGEPGLLRDWGFTPAFRDITGNGAPDLYVTNDFWTPDRLWLNNGDGTFSAAPPDAIRNQSYSSMGVDFTDLDKNGTVDFVVTEMLSGEHERRIRQYSDYLDEYQGATHNNHNSVYLNRGDTTFAQIAWYSSLEATEWSWATQFLDVDLDGHEDLVVATGFYRDYLDMDTQIEINRRYDELGEEMMAQQNVFLRYPMLALKNKIFRNNGDLTFSEKSSDWGFEPEDISMGMALADLNNDGVLDLIINRFNDEALIYENRTEAARIAVRLNGNPPNTKGIGAKVKLEGGPVPQAKELTAGGNYLSGSQPQVVFAAKEENENHTLVVHWRNGNQSRIEHVKANRIYEIDETGATNQYRNDSGQKAGPSALFEEISDRLGHEHHESRYDDFQRVQPLLPKSLSRQGPGVAWLDYHDTGFENAVITSGKGGRLSMFEYTGQEGFKPVAPAGLSIEAQGDQTAIAGWKEKGRFKMVIGSSNYEQGDPQVSSAYIHTFGNTGPFTTDSIPGVLSSTGPVAAADYSGNGFPDLFIGGHFLPGGYPKEASSRLFLNRGGEFAEDPENTGLFAEVGLVTGGVFADVTGNGRQDLLLSTEWGTLKLFENRTGRYHEITEKAGLDRLKGWWNGVAVGDFTNNGKLDFVSVNMGLNSPYRTGVEHPIRLFYEDINMNRRLDIVDSYYDEGINAYVPRRKMLDFRSVPTILQNVSSHKEFSVASVDEIFGLDFRKVPFKEINTLEHMVFINTGNGFEAKPLPVPAQFSIGNHAVVADFDNDGNEDLFISQNSFEFPSLVTRQDAGRGLLLLGDGNGNFKPLSGTQSGIKIYGEQRGAAVADFDRDGKTDLIVSQNGSQTRLYINRTKKRGVRVKLTGPDTNASAIGSSLRIVYADGTRGPRRIVQAGNGGGSQNGFVQVMGLAEEKTPVSIEITWPNGSLREYEFTKEKYEYDLRYDS